MENMIVNEVDGLACTQPSQPGHRSTMQTRGYHYHKVISDREPTFRVYYSYKYNSNTNTTPFDFFKFIFVSGSKL